MTVSYKVSPRACCGILRIHSRWRGSLCKILWPNYVLFLVCYFGLSVLYRFSLNPAQQLFFIKITKYSDKYSSHIPISFVLGFYVSAIAKRWWDQFQSIPWIDSLALIVSVAIVDGGERERMYRRAIVRHTCLAITQTFTLISPRVKRRFPTPAHLVEAGLLLEHELEILQDPVHSSDALAQFPTNWIPFSWAVANIGRARAEGLLKTDALLKTMIDEINRIKDKCMVLVGYDWVNIPLAYTQVVTLAVYTYFLSCLMSRQWLPPTTATTAVSSLGPMMANDTGTGTGFFNNETESVFLKKGAAAGAGDGGNILQQLDLIFPIFTTLQFFFFMGWLKVAESLLHPFGDEDDDIELNWVVDRNFQVGLVIVDKERRTLPALVKDPNWDNVVPESIPHTVGSWRHNETIPESSTLNVNVSSFEGRILPKAKTHCEQYKKNMASANGRGGGTIMGRFLGLARRSKIREREGPAVPKMELEIELMENIINNSAPAAAARKCMIVPTV